MKLRSKCHYTVILYILTLAVVLLLFTLHLFCRNSYDLFLLIVDRIVHFRCFSRFYLRKSIFLSIFKTLLKCLLKRLNKQTKHFFILFFVKYETVLRISKD